MSIAVYEEMLRFVSQKTEDPRIRENQRNITRALVNMNPEVLEENLQAELRAVLRETLSARKLALGPEDEAKIDACADHATLRRWLRQAVVAPSVAEALR